MKTSLQLLTVLLLVSTFSFGQDLSKQIDSLIKDNYQKNPDVGISVGFIRNNEEYYTAYGNLNAESQIAITKNSVFEIASITKILTSNLVAQAIIDKKIKADDYIDDFLPKGYVLRKNLKNKIKISDLASHQSGLPDIDFGKLIELNPQQPINSVTKKTLTTMINNCSELIDYGSYRYSTIGYTLLGQILEKVYGRSYAEIIREKMIEPLQLTNTLTKDFNVKNRTVGHNADGGIQEFLQWNITASAGLVKSSASDMVTFLKVVLNEETEIGKAAILTEKVFYKDENREIGLGINIMTDDKNTIYLKSGDSMGQSSIICYNRAKNWGIILLLNQRSSKMRQSLLNEIYEKVLK
ncbi:serine hydrolase domain-containing protein [Cytophagaceae bacterium DM2B3-1]|uniref:Serine hydrolase domain-containing protein n=1 Tax=Xanthocytophaga flava TaxID=3048013 RepID=A0AAE3UA24_9BACT|nr:serine hydrolase domain-containing protein [Xanthocytophaga flavus]MDJ1473052.1 serine hydrolase domain-containing protein [Xanthocytophaga flavus]MDJ1484277.1 serine hydrolase domain-containing protein [Xanthocytophaga flavus]MDJ1495198.1 serine hydrolase domain-containing protein [Xanthocytophaga flavus]